MKLDTFYSVWDVSLVLSLNYRTILDLINKGELKSYRIGRIFRISQEQLEQFLQSNKNKNEFSNIKTISILTNLHHHRSLKNRKKGEKCNESPL